MNYKARLQNLNSEKRLWIALVLKVAFIILEIGGGFFSNSLALLSDAAHLFTDAAALIISIIAIQLSKRKADTKRTFGYYRFEILAAAFNAALLFLVAFYIFYEAYSRFFFPHPIQTTSMVVVASIGVAINFFSARLLQKSSEENLNIKSAYLDAKADMLSSLVVILTAIVIQNTDWAYVDSMMAVGISIWILPRSWSLLKESINILLEGVPEGINIEEINHALKQLTEISDVHDLHVWALTNGKISLTAHFVTANPTDNNQLLLKKASELLEQKFNITHSTIQIETVKCGHSITSH